MTSSRQVLRKSRVAVAVATVACSALLLAACSNSNDTSSSDSGAASVAGGASTEVRDAVEAAYKGDLKALPTESAPVAPNKNLWVISLAEFSASVAAVSSNVKEASQLLGWKTTVADGKGTPEGWNQGVRSAIADGADVIVLNAVECAPIKASLEQAKAAGITIVGAPARDCEKPLFDGNVVPTGDFDDFTRARAQTRADWTLGQLGGKPGTVVVVYETDYDVARLLDDTTIAAIKKGCPDCKIEKVNFTLGDLNTQLKGKVQAGLLKNPDAKVVLFPYDTAVVTGGAAAVQSSGIAPKDIAVMGGECAVANVDLIRKDAGQDACIGQSYEWYGWAAVDVANRLLQNLPTVDSGIGTQLVDRDHNLPASGSAYSPEGVDFKSNYRKLWGVS